MTAYAVTHRHTHVLVTNTDAASQTQPLKLCTQSHQVDSSSKKKLSTPEKNTFFTQKHTSTCDPIIIHTHTHTHPLNTRATSYLLYTEPYTEIITDTQLKAGKHHL